MSDSPFVDDIAYTVYVTALRNAITRCAVINHASPALTLRALEELVACTKAIVAQEETPDA